MTHDEIIEELTRLAPAQRAALRARFHGAKIAYLRCREFLGRVDGVHVGFDSGIYYDVWIGPRGALRSVTCLGRA